VPEFSLDGIRPRVHPDAYLAPTAVLIGDVEVAEGASIWFGAVLRADQARISVGPGSNVQDNVVVHCAEGLPTVVGAGATIGHGARIEGCVVEDEAVVGTGAIMLQRSRLGRGALLAAGSLLSEGQEVPAGHLAAGVPATVRKEVSGSSARWVADAARHYVEAGRRFRRGLGPPD
jgi:carbonic anhydrase/acetyltransferase-like protein (isoleucine patch superfamily)